RLLEPAAEPLSGALVTAQVRATMRNTGRWERPVQAGLHSDQDGREIARRMTLEDARHDDEERGFALLPITAGPQVEARGEHPVREEGDHGRGVGVHAEPEVHPLDARVQNLQG